MQSPARESTLRWKANEFTNDVKALGSALLSALEKKLRQGQEIALLHVVRAVKQKQIDDANLVVAGLQKNQNLVTIRRGYYKAGDAAPRYRVTSARPCGPEIGEGIAW
jgi:hypothetical protein